MSKAPIRSIAAVAVLLLSLVARTAAAGAVFISGDDSDDMAGNPAGHCRDSNCGQMIGRLLSKLYNECGATTSLPPGILVVGANSGDALSAIQGWNLPVNGGPNAPLMMCNSIACIQSEPLTSHRLLYVATSSLGQGTSGGLTQAQLDALNLRAAEIQNWVNTLNGRVLALSEAEMNNEYGWLPNPLVSADFAINGTGPLDAYRTDQPVPPGPAGTRTIENEFFGGLPPPPGPDDNNINHYAYHNYFTGPAGYSGLKVLLEVHDAIGHITTPNICPDQNRIPDPVFPNDPNKCIYPPVALGCCSCQLVSNAAPSCQIGGGPFVAACQTGVIQTINIPSATLSDLEGGDLTYVWTVTNTNGDLTLVANPPPPGAMCMATTCTGMIAAPMSPIVNVPITPLIVERNTAQSMQCGETQTLTLTVTDTSNNSSSCQATVTFVSAGTPPVVIAPPNQTIPCNEDVPGPPEAVTVTSQCDPNPTVTFQEQIQPNGCPTDYFIIRTWTATDACGQTGSATQTIHVVDLPPTITLGPGTIGCNQPPPLPTLSDDCSPFVQLGSSFTTSPGTCPVIQVRHYTWTATDSCGHVTSVNQDVFITDTTPPVLSGVPPDVTVNCVAPPPAQPTATDDCSTPTITLNEVITPGNCLDRATVTRTWTASDGCNQVSATQVISVIDNTAPTITGVPPSVTVQCDAVPPPAAPVATDNCDPAPVLVFAETQTPGSCPDSYTIVRTWTATDRCGNQTVLQQTITVIDDTPPVVAGCALVPVSPLPPNPPGSAGSPGSPAPPLPPAPPGSPASPGSAAFCQLRSFRVECGTMSDNCDPLPTVSAELIVTHQTIENGMCVVTEEHIPVNCNDVVDVQILAAPCAPDEPASAGSPGSSGSAPVPPPIQGQRIRLSVVATDRCSNVGAACEVDVPSDCPSDPLCNLCPALPFNLLERRPDELLLPGGGSRGRGPDGYLP